MWEELLETIGKFNGKFRGCYLHLHHELNNCERKQGIMTKIDTNKLVNWDERVCYSAAELGLESGEWDYVLRTGRLGLNDTLESYVEILVDIKYSPVTIFGKTIKASEIIKELMPDEWEYLVTNTTHDLISLGTIREIK